MPAAFDMPLQEMRTYAGSNPRPKDFDQFWASALAELENTDPDVELRVADFRILNFRCLDLRFNGVRGSRVYAKVIVPEHADGKMPAVLKFHGYSGNSGDWFDLLPFAAMGNVVAALDCRGASVRARGVISGVGDGVFRGGACPTPECGIAGGHRAHRYGGVCTLQP